MEFNLSNPFVPRASIIRYPNGVFEIRLHLHGIASSVEIVQHDNYVLATGRLIPRARKDCQGLISNLIVILQRHQDCDDYVIRYTLRNRIVSVPTCAQYAQLDAYSTRPFAPYQQDIYGGSGGLAGCGAGPCAKGADCTCLPGTVGLNGGQGVWQNQGVSHAQGYYYPHQYPHYPHHSGFNIGASFNAGVGPGVTAPQAAPAVAQPIPNQEGFPLS
ncbi:hypothetical protein BU17DRAFT_67685 [Hysterangium stoloniferum]|nr:hypothetical protein BU17DRAFT_67685 [Hysterangium stoloniferum]